MNISTIIKSLMVEAGKKQQDLQSVLSISSKQAVNNKFARNGWTVADLVKVATYLDGDLILRVGDREIKLTEAHLAKEGKENA